jgi:Lrp/AsnC family leucine-responsive transcriptional regulator
MEVFWQMKLFDLDTIDINAIKQLMRDGRITWATLAGLLGLSGPAVAERVRQLEAQGIIRQYVALVDPETLGYVLTAFIAVTLSHPKHRAIFAEQVKNWPEVLECHHIAGDDDYLLKVRCTSTRHLDWLINDRLKSSEAIARTRTTIVLSTLKETTAVPLDSEYHDTN